MKCHLFAVLALGLLAGDTAHAAPWSLTVVDDKGAPVAGVRVQLRSSWEDGTQMLETDGRGEVKGDLDPRWSGTVGRVFLYARGYAAAGGRLETGPNRVTLETGRSVAGRVIDAEGRPLKDVEVGLTNVFADFQDGEAHTLQNSVDFFVEGKERTLFTARTDADGRYQVAHVPRVGTGQITVTDAAWQGAAVRLGLADDAVAPDIQARPAARLRGRVLRPDGTPAANVLLYGGGNGTYNEAETDAEGRYTLGSLAAGTARLSLLSLPLQNTAVAGTMTVEAVAGTETPVPDIKMTPGATLRIRAVPEIAGGLALRGDGPENEVPTYFLAPHGGAILARVLPGAYHLTLDSVPEGWLVPQGWPAAGQKIHLFEGQETSTEIKLQPALTLAGIVTDEAGKPLAGVSFSEPVTGKPAISDAEGRFILHNLAPGKTQLATAAAWDVITPGEVAVPAAAPVTVTVRPKQLVPVRGRVVTDTGAPLAGAAVRLEWYVMRADGSGNPVSTIIRRTDEQGRYEFDDVRADADMNISAQKARHRLIRGGESSIARTILGVNGTPQPNPNAAFTISDFVMQPLTREAKGRVVDEKGVPVAGALVAALGGGEETPYGLPPATITRTDTDGRFRLADLPSGPLGFVAGAGDGYGAAKYGEDGVLDIVLKPLTHPRRDLDAARALVLKLMEETRTGEYYARRSLPMTLAAYDYDAANATIDVMGLDARGTAELQRSLLWKLVETDPRRARVELPPHLAEVGEAADAWLALAVASLVPNADKADVADRSPGDAALLAWARRALEANASKLQKIEVDKNSDFETAAAFTALAALATRLGRDDARQFAEKALNIADRYAKTQREGHGEVASIVEGLAEGGAGLVEAILPDVPPTQRAYGLGRAVPIIARADLPGARRLLELIPAQAKPGPEDPDSRAYNADPEWAFGLAAKAVLRRMTVADAAAALALARRVTTDSHRPEALALAARLQPEAEAAKLFDEAFELALKEQSERYEPAVLLAALSSYPEIGARLLQKLDDLYFKRRETGQMPPLSPPAFYLAQFQPGRARVWLEWKLARAQNGPEAANGLQAIAMAMSAVDTARALEIAGSIPPRRGTDGKEDYTARWEAQRKIAQYLGAPEKVRQTLDFNRWNAGDSWTPGDDTGW